MRFSVNVPNFGDFADARAVATVARAAEDAGWDGLFVWDHVVHRKEARRGQPFGDPWMLLTAAALATSTIRLGTLVTPVARRRPEQLARQVATLDALSGGRVVFGAGLGGPVEDEFGSFGDETDPVVLAEKLDEGLGLLARYWAGERVDHDGPHYRVHDVEILPATVQRPRPPVWVGGFWPARRPFRRAARWDGVVPLFASGHGEPPTPDEVREVAGYVAEHRTGTGAYDVVVGGLTAPEAAADVVGPLVEAGATWWDERGRYTAPELYSLPAVLRRVEAGPPRL
ncbi:LLM class flavin-dependent oxidoreductase [Promicromonospora sukumoe]|uniref:LLM class flavin-dependent oxidoreductase n=1 Tax=Promicromonospora sukumoe TaxID=88382 RepID=UPI00035D3F0C|nr:LLM class flavin-dependent oxidoreductase [Promicromonospora sukumoe]